MSQKKKFYSIVTMTIIFMIMSIFFILYYVNNQINNQTTKVVVLRTSQVGQGEMFDVNNVDDLFVLTDKNKLQIESGEGWQYYTNMDTVKKRVASGNFVFTRKMKSGQVLYADDIIKFEENEGGVKDDTLVEVPISSVQMSNVANKNLKEGNVITIVGMVNRDGDVSEENRSISTIYSGAIVSSIHGDINSGSISMNILVNESSVDSIIYMLNYQSGELFYLDGKLSNDSVTIEKIKDQYLGNLMPDFDGVPEVEYLTHIDAKGQYKPLNQNELLTISYSKEDVVYGFDLRWKGLKPDKLYIEHYNENGNRGRFYGQYKIGETNNNFNISYNSRTEEFNIGTNNNEMVHFRQAGAYAITMEKGEEKYEYFVYVKTGGTDLVVDTSMIKVLNKFDYFVTKGKEGKISFNQEGKNFLDSVEAEFNIKATGDDKSFEALKLNVNEKLFNTYDFKIDSVTMKGFKVAYGFAGVQDGPKAFQAQKDRIIQALIKLSKIDDNIKEDDVNDLLTPILKQESGYLDLGEGFFKTLNKLTYFQAEEMIKDFEDDALVLSIRSNGFHNYAHIVYMMMGGELMTDYTGIDIDKATSSLHTDVIRTIKEAGELTLVFKDMKNTNKDDEGYSIVKKLNFYTDFE